MACPSSPMMWLKRPAAHSSSAPHSAEETPLYIAEDHTCPWGTACAARTFVSLGMSRELAFLLRPLRRLLFFRGQGGLLLHVFLLFEFLGHGVRSHECGVFVWTCH